jgi:flagellar hook-associated protein 2
MSSLPSINVSSLLSAMGSSSQGIDVASTVAQLISVQRAPERQWMQDQNDLQTQADALTKINTLTSGITQTLNDLKDPLGALSSVIATSSQDSIVGVSAGAGALAGDHTVVVNNLASTGSWYSDVVASGDTTLPPGTFDLQIGSNAPTTITVGSGVNTLNGLVSYINGQNLGVRASVVTDANGARLALVSNTSGAAGDITISNTSGLAFTRAVEGKNASLTIDGIPITSASNTVAGAVDGVTFQLRTAAPGTPVNIKVSPDVDKISKSIQSFVNGYNSVIKEINSQFTYNTSTQTAGPLAGDSGLRILQTNLLSAGSYSSSGDTIATLRAVGVSMNNDGTLTLDSTQLTQALQGNFDAVRTFFHGTAGDGFAGYLSAQLEPLVDSTEGAFTVELKSISATKDSLQDQIDRFEVYIAGEQTRLSDVYNNANIMLQQMPYRQQQIDALLGNFGGSKK